MASASRLRGIKILAGLWFLGAFACVAVVVLLAPGLLEAALGLVQAFFAALVGFGLLKLKNWARILTLAAFALSLPMSLLTLVPPLFQVSEGLVLVPILLVVAAILAIPISVIWYLVRPQVKQAFGPPRETQ